MAFSSRKASRPKEKLANNMADSLTRTSLALKSSFVLCLTPAATTQNGPRGGMRGPRERRVTNFETG